MINKYSVNSVATQKNWNVPYAATVANRMSVFSTDGGGSDQTHLFHIVE
jgi:hypothetical protein